MAGKHVPKVPPKVQRPPPKPVTTRADSPRRPGETRSPRSSASATRSIPVCVKHMTVAIFKGPHIAGVGTDRFLNAFMVARFRLMQYGYLTSGSDTGPTDQIGLTAAGVKLEREKSGSAGTAAKQALFDKLFLQWESARQQAGRPAP